MRRVGFAVSALVLLAGTSAYAQTAPASITSVTTSANTTLSPASVIEGPAFPNSLGAGAGSGSFPTSQYFNPTGSGMWNSYVDTTTNPGLITFQSDNALGANSATRANMLLTSTSTVQIGVQNGQNLDLHSTITPAGMGFYVADVGNGACIATGTCAEVAPGSEFDFADFGAAVNAGYGAVGFNFTVTASAAGFDDVTLYSVSGSIQLSYDGHFIPPFLNLDDAEAKLTGFQLDTPEVVGDTPYHSLGYSWLETGFDPTVGLLNTSFQTITYQTTVFSTANAPCLSNGTTTACLLAYAGFGDPIGRGGGTALDVASFSSFGFDDGPVLFNHDGDTGITGLNFSPYTITAPRIEGGTLFVGGQAVVPEPATWMSMIMGFGLLGAAMRRRRALAHA